MMSWELASFLDDKNCCMCDLSDDDDDRRVLLISLHLSLRPAIGVDVVWEQVKRQPTAGVVEGEARDGDGDEIDNI